MATRVGRADWYVIWPLCMGYRTDPAHSHRRCPRDVSLDRPRRGRHRQRRVPLTGAEALGQTVRHALFILIPSVLNRVVHLDRGIGCAPGASARTLHAYPTRRPNPNPWARPQSATARAPLPPSPTPSSRLPPSRLRMFPCQPRLTCRLLLHPRNLLLRPAAYLCSVRQRLHRRRQPSLALWRHARHA